eukprot:TRINITY_DN38_c0_g1_i1.p1 TRINITY_DN38_c0_g1~~TRINITY_DN38_c0_g1_i1.p1  ORF type:complete len:290 (-),score=111.26 TRINITY_DN38_c0_g1_i1:71-940(-)
MKENIEKEETKNTENNNNENSNQEKPKKDINLVGKRLWVTNLDYKFTWQDLKDHFNTAGVEVAYSNILKDHNDRSTGSGIVEFHNREDALIAYNKLNYSKIRDSKFHIYIREDREDFSVKPKSNFKSRNNNGNYNNRNNDRNNNSRNNNYNDNRSNNRSNSRNNNDNYNNRNNDRNNNNSRYNNDNRSNNKNEKNRSRPKSNGTINKKQVFLGNLPYAITWQDLRDIFHEVGEIEKTHVYLNYAGRSRGNGFVLFKEEKDAEAAIEKFNGMNLNDREIIVKLDEFSNSN